MAEAAEAAEMKRWALKTGLNIMTGFLLSYPQ